MNFKYITRETLLELSMLNVSRFNNSHDNMWNAELNKITFLFLFIFWPPRALFYSADTVLQ
jgi:hypothetical protein